MRHKQDPALVVKLKWHYTPPHSSWLSLAECELSVLTRQCLNHCFTEQAALATATAA